MPETSTLTCPDCHHQQVMAIPENACQAFYHCYGCGKLIMATKSCCVFCDYGDKPCSAVKNHQQKNNNYTRKN